MADAKITPEVRDVLERSSIEGNKLTLPYGQLARPIYDAVNKVLVNAGGKWNKSKKGHVFPSDPRVKLGLALESGVAVDEKKKLQAFYTPVELAQRLVELSDVSGHRVLEPSAGGGALVRACLNAGATHVDAIEISEECRKSLTSIATRCTLADFLELGPYMQFDRIVMNPPFTKRQDVKHVIRALKWLSPVGRLASIMTPNVDVSKLQEVCSDRTIEKIPIEAGAFKASGTTIATCIVVIQ